MLFEQSMATRGSEISDVANALESFVDDVVAREAMNAAKNSRKQVCVDKRSNK